MPKLIWFVIDIACGVFLLVNLKILQKNAYKFKNHTFEYGGDIKDGLANGQGKYNSSSGDKYVGEFKDGTKNGQGTMTLPDGSKYVGEFKDGEKWNGTQYDKDGNITKKYVNGVKQK